MIDNKVSIVVENDILDGDQAILSSVTNGIITNSVPIHIAKVPFTRFNIALPTELSQMVPQIISHSNEGPQILPQTVPQDL